MAHQGICAVSGCGNTLIVAHGWCNAHYRRWKRNGNPTAGTAGHGDLSRFIDEVAVKHVGDDCLPWPFAAKTKGYGSLTYKGKRSCVASRVVCELVHGSPPTPEHEAAHSCGRRDCVNPNHLRWATSTQNHADKLIHGTHNRGERHGMAKLGWHSVKAMRILGKTRTRVEVAKLFRVSERTVGRILAGQTWKEG